MNLQSAPFPDTRAGEIAVAFFNAYAAGDDASLSQFEQTFRAASALASRPVDERLKSWQRFRREWGVLKPAKYAEAPDGSLFVLAHADADEGWKSFCFKLEADAPHKLVGIDIASPVTMAD